jgi:Glycosyl hydrolases family 39
VMRLIVYRHAIVLSILLMLVQSLCPQAMAQATVTADFGGRSNTTAQIPAGIFGINVAALKDSAIMTDIVQSAGIIRVRRMAGIQTVYATATPNWGDVDWYLANVLKPQSVNVLIVLSFTPKWLQPSSNTCADPKTAPPTSISAWAQIAAAYVAHMDRTFPGMVTDYEIWNEPELQKSFCVTNNTDATRLSTYLALYAAAAKAMRAQATLDGVHIRIGGPTISNLTYAQEWIGKLLSNSATAPYVDFVSYHQYPTGQRQISGGMNWSMLYSFTQSSTLNGESYAYNQIRNLVRNGSQPNRWSTPIYITEYNDNWVFGKDCCRNDPTFGPLWNSVAIVDFLNTAYTGSHALPSRVYYFAGSAAPYFCIAGTWNSNMDCDPSEIQLYPQYYAFQMFGGSDYLGLKYGGRMAVSVSSTNSTSGLLATAYYNSACDVLVIVNPTGTTYSSVKVVAQNTGIKAGSGNLLELGPSSPRISRRSVGLANSSGTYTGWFSIPAYTTVALTIKP